MVDEYNHEMLERQAMLNSIRRALLWRLDSVSDEDGGRREACAERPRRLGENCGDALEEAQVALNAAAPLVCVPGDAGKAARRRIGRIDEMFYELRALFDGLAADVEAN